MASVLPHPETLFISAEERFAAEPQAAPTKTLSISEKISRLKKKRELADDLQTMIARSGLTIEELREALNQ
ncbi:hypothetical protein [Chitinibacter sp. S2-10]|uniref:hypothetical protein n=1 Tax=Chitinibacter sp. S2-10 TaxID=3373597 RepID=UPI003977B65C